MPEVSPVTLTDAKAVADAVNSLRSEGMIFVVSLTFIIISYMTLIKFFAWKRETQMSKQKNDRVEANLKALNTLSENINLMNNELAIQGKLRTNHFEAMVQAQDKINEQLTDMNNKIRGIIPDVDASKIIKVYFNNIIKREISFLVEAQIIENGFIENSDFIRRRMKTNIGDILDRCVDELKGLKLPIAVRSIFLTYNDEDGERYQVCDLIWEPVAEILSKKGEKSKKIEEAKLVISNVINDYINPVLKELNETPSGVYKRVSIK